MIKWITGLGGKIQAGLAAVGIILAAIGIAFIKGRKAGVEHIELEQQRKRDALQQEYDQIDAGPSDPSGAYERLRKRSGGR